MNIYDLFISRWIGEAETMARCSLSASDIQVFESGAGVHDKPSLPKVFHERHAREFGGESGAAALPPEMQFLAVLRGLLALFSLFLVDLLSRSLHNDIAENTVNSTVAF